MSLNFDGANDYVDIGNTGLLGAQADFSVSVWMLPRGDEFAAIVADSTLEFWLLTEANQTLIFYVNDLRRDSSAGLLTLDAWQHVAFTFTNDIGEGIFYVDGVADAPLDYSSAFGLQGPLVDMTFGIDSRDNLGYEFNGQLEDIRIYDRHLSAPEVDALFQSSRGQVRKESIGGSMAAGLVGHWPMRDEPIGTPATAVLDHSGNGNHGTGFGGASLAYTAPAIWVPTQALDSSGNGNHGTYVSIDTSANSPAFSRQTDPRIPQGLALEYDGVASYVSIPNGVSLLNGLSACSAFLWVYTNDTSVSESASMFNHWESVPGPNSLLLLMRADTDDLRVILTVSAAETGDVTASNVLLQETWQHIGFTYSSDSFKVYVDGIQAGITDTTCQAPVATVTGSTNLRIGGSPGQPSEYQHAGKLDDARIYNRALSAAEVSALYNNDRAGANYPADSDMLGWWKFDRKAV